MKEMAYFELFGRISDRFVTEALLPVAVPVSIPKKGFKATPIGRFLTNPAVIAIAGTLAAVAIAVVVGMGLAGQGDDPKAPMDTFHETGRLESREDADDSDPSENMSHPENPDGDVTFAETNEQAENGEHPYIERKNYNGKGLNIIYGKDLMGEGFSYLPEDMIFAGATALNSDLYERIQMTEDYLGVRIGFLELEDDSAVRDKMGFMSGAWEADNSIFLASGQVVAWMGGGSSSYMTAWDTLDAINTKADYWDTALMETHTQGGHSYIAYSNFIPPNAYAIAYNKSLYAASASPRDLYGLVESGDWTVDTLMSVLNETASINGTLSTHSYSGVNAYLAAVGFHVMDTVELEGGYTQSLNVTERTEALTPLYLKAMELITSQWVHRVTIDNRDNPFIEDGEVLMDTRLTRDLAGKTYGKPVGVLPLPKYDKAQSAYLSFHVNAYMGMWCNQDNKQMCGEIAELLAYFSRNSYEDYNRAVMGVYGKDDREVQKDLAMLRIIHDTTHDMGLNNSYLIEQFAQPLLNGQSDITFLGSSRFKNAARMVYREFGW